MNRETFTEAELRVTEVEHTTWFDGFCSCWSDGGFSGEAHMYNLDHLLDVVRAERAKGEEPTGDQREVD